MMSGNSNGVDIRSVIKAVADKLFVGKFKGAHHYIAELTWILFLRMLDDREEREQEIEEGMGGKFHSTLSAPYRWRDWASPESPLRAELADSDGVLEFVRGKLFPHLKGLKDSPKAGVRQRVASQIFIGVDYPRTDEQTILLNILDKIHLLRESELDTQHDFPISRVYEELLLGMSQHGRDTGQFFTPREVIRAMIRVVDPKPGEQILDPCCGTGGFLAQAREYIRAENPQMGGKDMKRLAQETFYGREQEAGVYPLALANMIMHGVNRPNIWHGDTLTRKTYYGGLFDSAPEFYNVVLTNPPFGAKLADVAKTHYDIKSSSSQVLFAQEMIKSLRQDGGRCGVVFDEGFMFGANDSGLVETRKLLLESCDLWCVVSLPSGVFASTGAGVKTNLLFFCKGSPTHRTWYYDLSEVKLTKKRLLTLDDFGEFFRLYPKREEGENSWVVDFDARKTAARAVAKPHEQAAASFRAEMKNVDKLIAAEPAGRKRDQKRIAALREKRQAAEAKAKKAEKEVERIKNAVYDLRAVNQNKKAEVDTRTPKQLLEIVSGKQREIGKLLAELEKTGE